MGLKYFLLAFVAIFALQGIAEAKTVPAIDTYGLGETIENIFRAIAKIINEAITAAVNQLKDLINKIIVSGNAIVAEVIEKVKAFVETAIGNLTALIAKAKELGIDIQECLGDNMEEIENIPKTTLIELTKCVDDQVEHANLVIDDAVQVIKNILNDVAALQKEFSECKDIVCMATVIQKATRLLNSLPEKINATIREAIEFINQLPGQITECSSKTLNTTVQRLSELSKAISDCINSKIPEQS